MSDHQSENGKLRPVREVARVLTGENYCRKTVSRWIRHGCYGVRLEAVMLAGCWHCTEDDFNRFIKGQTESALRCKRNQAGVPNNKE